MSGGVQPAGPNGGGFDVFANTALKKVPGEVSFKDILAGQVAKVQGTDETYQKALENYLQGADNQDEVVIAFRKKQFAFDALLQVRNKLVDGLNELMQLRF